MARSPVTELWPRPGDAPRRSTDSILLDLVVDALVAIDEQARVIFWNAGAERLYGVAREVALGSPLASLYTYLWDSAESERRALDALATDGEWRGENVHVLRSGERRRVESTVRALRADDGRPAGMVALIRDVTERERAQAALRESEAALEAFFAHSPGILNLEDEALRYLKTDPTTPTYFGLTREALVGKSVEELAPAFMAEFGPMLRRVLETGEPRLGVEVHSPIPGRPGEVASWRASYFPVPLPGGRRGLGVMGVEITDLKKAEAALRQAHEQLRAHVEATPLGLVVWDADYRVTAFSRRAEELLGWAAEEVIGRRIDEIPWVPEEDWPSVRAVMRDMATGARPANVNANRNVRKDGRVISCEWYSSTLCDAAGRVTSILSLVLDVTERERALEELRRVEAAWNAMSQSTPVLVALKDRQSRLLYANPAVLSLNGRPAEENYGRSDVERFGPEVGGPIVANDVRVMRTRATESMEELTPDGRVWLATKSPWLDERGEVVGVIVVAHDITERKRAERALEEQQALLEAANERLRQADQRKDEFLAVLSHELRNPLAPIGHSLAIMERVPHDSVQAGRAREVIGRQVAHLTRLVEDLLDVTRISRGKVQLQREPTDLRELVRRAAEDHRDAFDQGEVALAVELPAAPVWADVDRTRIAQVVGNLLSNAAKFTPPRGAVRLRLETAAGRAEIAVRDTGIGIDAAQLARTFEPFAQEARGLARSKGGLGLGLALSKGLVEAHGGAMTAGSDGPGRGAVFTVNLPLAAPPASGPAPGGPGCPPASPALASGSRRRILLVDDNVDAAETLQELLRGFGHEVAVATDGASGIAQARALRPDVVVCDVGLPDVSGYEVARALRQDPALERTRLIALSGYGYPQDKQRAREAGFDAHFTRPAPLDALLAALDPL